MQVASPQTEASAKAENAVTFTTESEKVQTIATWQPASRQVLDDFDELAAFIRGSLAYYVELEEELQMLSGSGAGTDLNGLITQATPFDSSLLSGSWQRIDVIGAAIQQVEEAKEIEPTFAVLNPRDWWLIRRTKDANDNYILGAPGSEGSRRLWDLDVIATNNMDAGDFLVGSGNPAAAEIRDRMEMQIEVSTQHEDYFTRNLVAIRAEKRLALITKRPASFIEGTFTTSP
jgi:HK97 family phage major capsid protein